MPHIDWSLDAGMVWLVAYFVVAAVAFTVTSYFYDDK